MCEIKNRVYETRCLGGKFIKKRSAKKDINNEKYKQTS